MAWSTLTVYTVFLTSLLLSTATAMRTQQAFPACAVHHKPKYFCCEYGEEKELFTRFNRPSGGAFAPFYEEGWRQPRQVNFPVALYTPDSPVFTYTDPEAVCRMQNVYNSRTNTVQSTLQCGPGTTIQNSLGETIVTNASLPDDSQYSDVFWTSRTGLRNSNASFVIGATCTSLMLANGNVDTAAKERCVSPGHTATYQFTTFTEAPLLAIYFLYGLLLLALLVWVPLRAMLACLLRRRDQSQHRPHGLEDGILIKSHRGGATTIGNLMENGMKETMVGSSGITEGPSPGLTMPMLTPTNRDTSVRADHLEQTGYRDSLLGKAILSYFVVLTIGLFPIMIVVVLDNNRHFEPALFDPVNVLILVFILLWVVTTCWFVFLVLFYDKLRNFFRVREPLHQCQYVRLFNPDVREIELPDHSGVSQCIAKLQAVLLPSSREGYEATHRVQMSPAGHRFVDFQHLRYIYDDQEDRFVPGSVPLPSTFAQCREQGNGLRSLEVARRQAVVGRNTMQIAMPSTATSIADEVFHLFYVHELMCYLVWYFTGYYVVAILNTVIIVGVVSFNIVAKRRLLASVLHMTRVHGGVAVKRDGLWQTIAVSELVPGDLVRVVENWDLPCDLVLLTGTVVCDESSLTGESMPVQKCPVPSHSTESYDPATPLGKKHTLFTGGRTLASSAATRTNASHDESVAVVTATGAHTLRGQLLQSILYPALVRFKYEEHLKACVLFLLAYGIVAASIAMRLLMANAGLSNTLFAFVFGMFMLSAVLSPLIPVVLTICQYNASKRLQSRGIFCLNPARIALCGKVRVFAFDKTGTITKKGLDFRGVVPVTDASSAPVSTDESPALRRVRAKYTKPQRLPWAQFQDECRDVTQTESLDLMLQFALASCHAVGYLEDELVGDEVEVKMFQATQWRLVEEHVVDADGQEHVRSIVESPDGSQSLAILKRFEFDHNRACMSVLVEDLHSRRRYVFTKGSYETLATLTDPRSQPLDYSARAEALAKDGCYVLGMGFKELPKLDLGPVLSDRPSSSENLGEGWLRESIESDLSFVGLLSFQNQLKHDSAEVVAKLKAGDIRVVMITGDNAMTGCYIARASGMIPASTRRVILGEMQMINDHGARGLVWRDVDSFAIVSHREIQYMAERQHIDQNEDHWELAVTGAAFTYLQKMDELRPLLFHIRIFSRMTPVEKTNCVAAMMAAGAVTGMCGDGGNDCGALRIAHVGVALSDAEASVVSSFTSHGKSIDAVLEVCREGRCALATSFGNLKFLILYGCIGCGLRFTQYANGLFLAQYAFMFCDALVLVGLSYAISLAKPLRLLGPFRPTSSLVGPTTILSLLGQLGIHVLCLYLGVGMLVDATWYCPFRPEDVDLKKWWLLQDSHLGSTLFLLSAAQYIVTALSFGFGANFHQPVHKNRVLVGYTALLLGLLLYLAVGEPSVVTERFRMSSSTNVIGLPDIPMPIAFRWNLVLLIAANMLAIVVYERFVVLGPVKRLLRRRFHRDRLQLRP